MQRLLGIVAGLLLLAAPATTFAAIAFGSQADGLSTTGTSLSYSSGTVSGSNTFGVVWVDGGVSNDNITGVTWNGTSMTLAGKQHTGLGADRWQYMFYGFGVSTGNIVVSGTPSDYIAPLAAWYTGTNQSGLDGSLKTTGAPNWTNTITTTCDNDWHIGAAGSNSGAVTAGSGTTRRIASSVGDSGAILDNNAAITPAGANSIIGNNIGLDGWLMGIAIAPAGVGPTCGGSPSIFSPFFWVVWW